nr:LicD family protein [uncultured Sphaerochaeta sp.]
MQLKPVNQQEMRDIQLQILEAIDLFCKEREITYFLTHGTLIGAIRHNGYIPWDDDIDIAMPREGYEEFLKSFSHDSIRIYSLQTSRNCRYPYAKAYYTHTAVFEGAFQKYSEYGVNIDIFPYDYLPEPTKQRKKLLQRTHFWQLILKTKLSRISPIMTLKQNVVIFFGKILLFPVQSSVLARRIVTLAEVNREKTSRMGCLVWGYGERESAETSVLVSTQAWQFEGRSFLVPLGYDALLTSMYGSYMELPPVEKQITHHDFKAYWNE